LDDALGDDWLIKSSVYSLLASRLSGTKRACLKPLWRRSSTLIYLIGADVNDQVEVSGSTALSGARSCSRREDGAW